MALRLVATHEVTEPRVSSKRAASRHTFDEHLLRHFLGLRRITNDLQHDPVDERRERIVRAEACLIAPPAGARTTVVSGCR